MRLTIMNKDSQAAGNITLPKQFNEPVRADLVKRAVLALQSNARQQYGASPTAGKRPSVRISKRRHDYRTTYGIGQSRTPRKVMSYRGSRFNWTGAFAPQTVGGRRAHPPKAEKEWDQKINDKERRKAIRAALAATMNKEVVEQRGHKAPASYPFIITAEFESMDKTKDVKQALDKLGLAEELARAEDKKIRAGKGKMRGRKYKQAKSALIVTAQACPLTKAASSIPGVDVVTVEELNAELLAPGAAVGRLTLYTQTAIEKLDKERLFTEQRVKKTTPVKEAAQEQEHKKPVTKTPAAKAPATKKTTSTPAAKQEVAA